MKKTLLLLLTCMLVSCSEPAVQQEIETVEQRLAAIDSQIQQIAQAYTRNATPDFASIQNSKAKKQAFFDFLSPAINAQNLAIERDQLHLSTIITQWDSQGSLTAPLKKQYHQLLRYYRVNSDSFDSNLAQLKTRIGALPKALVLAQAANESAWGTSRFAREGNNYFGQWCHRKGCGLVPRSRDEGANHEVAVFDSAYGSVAAYFKNINSNPAYRHLRQIRVKAKHSDHSPSATQLVNGLLEYSERGEEYVADITRLINSNRALMN